MAYLIIPPTTYRHFPAYKQDTFWRWNIHTPAGQLGIQIMKTVLSTKYINKVWNEISVTFLE